MTQADRDVANLPEVHELVAKVQDAVCTLGHRPYVLSAMLVVVGQQAAHEGKRLEDFLAHAREVLSEAWAQAMRGKR